jgi:hypothetical protein
VSADDLAIEAARKRAAYVGPELAAKMANPFVFQWAPVVSNAPGVMSDLIDGRVAPNVANAICHAGGKLLKMVELQQKYGKRQETEAQSMRLTG